MNDHRLIRVAAEHAQLWGLALLISNKIVPIKPELEFANNIAFLRVQSPTAALSQTPSLESTAEHTVNATTTAWTVEVIVRAAMKTPRI